MVAVGDAARQPLDASQEDVVHRQHSRAGRGAHARTLNDPSARAVLLSMRARSRSSSSAPRA